MAYFQKIVGVNCEIPWPVHHTSVIKAYKNIHRTIHRPGSAMGCYIDARNGLYLGENVIMGPKVSIISMNHDVSNFKNYKTANPIKIGNNSWLATGCIILPEVELGEHTVVAAGAVVTKSFLEGNQIIGGNPARVIKKIGDYETSGFNHEND
jgi:acetyltransferase-like isoleucine patch superfamily enzyme